MKSTVSRWRWLAVLAVFAMIVAACETVDPTTTTGDTAPPTTDDGTTPTTAPPSVEGFTYNVGIISDPTTDNAWAYLDTESDVYNSYVLASQGATLYTLTLPTYTYSPVVALPAEAPLGAADGDNWVIEVPLRQGLTWSDGEEVTADDFVFTWNTVKDLGLAGNFLDLWPQASEDDPDTEENEYALGLVDVTAPDPYTLVLTWNDQPGLAVWQFNTAFAPAYPEHFWAEHVAGAADAAGLYEVSGIGAPAFGADVVAEREPGAFVRNVASENYVYEGAKYTVYANGAIDFSPADGGEMETWGGPASGDVTVEYVDGPYMDEMIFSVYGSQDAAALALINGDIDFWMNPLTLSRGLQGQFLDAADLNVVANAGTGMFYMAFNTRRFPGNNLAFRQAVDCMIDKDFVAQNVLAGAVISMDTTVAPGNAYWSNPDVQSTCAGQTQEERLASAVQILKDGGWTWETEPEFLGGRDDVQPGVGLNLDGQTIQDIQLIAPGPGYDPMRATYSLWAQNFMNDIGIPVTANPTGFTTIVNQVFGPTDWDMYILGWSLGTFPDYMGAFFHSAGDSAEGGFNTPGYSNAEFDALSDAFDAATDLESARDIHFQMQEIIARDVPYVVLFTNVQYDVFRNTLEFPFTDFLQGITDGGAGLRAGVKAIS
ncbi:MAG: ABC transporter substrate-binding protein [Acidimicrobiia bacterium]|nr:ABC transporter substrate-binding protein [Acidimicrobiia bacterium]